MGQWSVTTGHVSYSLRSPSFLFPCLRLPLQEDCPISSYPSQSPSKYLLRRFPFKHFCLFHPERAGGREDPPSRPAPCYTSLRTIVHSPGSQSSSSSFCWVLSYFSQSSSFQKKTLPPPLNGLLPPCFPPHLVSLFCLSPPF